MEKILQAIGAMVGVAVNVVVTAGVDTYFVIGADNTFGAE